MQQQQTPYTYANLAPEPELTSYTDYSSYYPNQGPYIDPTQIQPWLPPMEPPLLSLQGYPHGYATSPGPQLLPPFQQFHPMQGGHTPPPPHLFFPEAVPGLPPAALPYLPYQPPVVESLQEPFFMHALPPTMTPPVNHFPNQIPIPVPKSSSSPAPDAVVYSPRPQLTPKHSFTRDPVLGSLTMSKSERVEKLEEMADEVAKKSRDLSGDLPRAAGAAAIGRINGDLNKTLPGPPVPSGKFGGIRRIGWDDGDDVISRENHDLEEGERKRRDLMSVFPAAVHDRHQVVQARDHHPQELRPSSVAGVTYQTPPTPTLMAVLGPSKQTLLPLPSTPAARTGKSPSDLLTSENGLDALERRLLAEVGTRKHLEALDNTTHHNANFIAEEREDENSGRRRRGGLKTKVFKDHQLGRRDVRDVLLSSSSPALAAATVAGNGNQGLPPIETDLDLDLDLVGREGGEDSRSGVGGNGPSAPISIPMKKSPDPLNESAISSLTLGGEGLASGLPDAAGTGLGLGLGFSNGGVTAVAGATGGGGDSDGDGDGEADFDGRTHRAGSASLSRGSNSGSDRMVLGGGGGRLRKHARQRAEVSTPTEMIAQGRDKPRRGGVVETKEKFKTSSGKKKDRLNGIGNSNSETKKSRNNKSSAAAKGRVAAWLGEIDPAVPPQEEIIPPSPSVVRDLDGLSFEDEQRAAVRLLGRSPLAAAAPYLPLSPNSASPTTPGGALTSNVRTDAIANGADDGNNKNEDKVVSASPNPRSSGFVSITTLKRDPISLPSSNSVVRRPLLLSRDATVIEEARRVQDLWSSPPPGITVDKDTLKPGGVPGAMSFVSHERFNRKLSPSSSFSKPAGVIPLSYSAAVASAPAPASSSAAPRNVWKTTDQTQPSTSQPKGRQLPPSTTKPSGYIPPGGKLPMFPPSKPPIDLEVKYDIRSARGGRGGKVSSVASLWASGAINNQSHHHQTTMTTTTAAANNRVKDRVKEAPKRLPNSVEEVPDSLPSKPSKAEKKLFSAAVMTPAPALKNVRAYTPTTVVSGNGYGSGGGPKKVTSTPALPVPSVGVPAGGGKVGKVAAASRSTDNLVAVQKRPALTATTMNFFQGGKITPTANLSTPSSSTGPPTGKLHDSTTTTTKRGIPGTKGIGKPVVVTGPPGVMIKATSDPAVISSSLAVPTLSSTASLVRPHDQNPTGQYRDYHRHRLQPRVAVVKLPTTLSSTAPGSGDGSGGSGSRSGSSVSPRPGSPPQVVVVANNNNNTTTDSKPTTELAFGQARLRDLIKKYQGSSPATVGHKS